MLERVGAGTAPVWHELGELNTCVHALQHRSLPVPPPSHLLTCANVLSLSPLPPAQALERQKEFFDSIRSERDDLREEVVTLKEALKVRSRGPL